MNFFQRIANLFRGNAQPQRRHFVFYVLSRRCNEPITSQIDLMNELSEAEDSDAAFYSRKLLSTSGRNRCFDTVEVELWFDKNKTLLRQEVSGGKWMTEDEYKQMDEGMRG